MYKIIIILLLLLLLVLFTTNNLNLNLNESFATNSEDTFENKTILITGGTRGLGFSIAKYLTRFKCTIIITGAHDSKLNYALSILKKLNPNISGFVVDLSNTRSIDSFYNQLKNTKIEVLINCAYKKPKRKELSSSNPGEFVNEIAINISGTFYLNQRILKIMRYNKSGKIFFISSPSSKAHDTVVYKSSDIISKNTIERMTDILSYENRKYNIGICTIRIDTGVFSNNKIDTSTVSSKKLKKIYNKTNDFISMFTTSPDEITKLLIPILKMPTHQINGKVYTTRMMDQNNQNISKFIPQSQIILKNKLYSTAKYSKHPGDIDIYINKQNPYSMPKSMEKILKSYDYSKQSKNIKSKYPKPLATYLSSKLKIEKDQIVFFNNEHSAIKNILNILIPKYDNLVTVFPLSEQFHFITSESKIDIKYTVYDVSGTKIQPKYKHIHNLITSKTKCIYLSNPNFLTGQTLIKRDFEKFIDKLPDNIIVILDETRLDLVTEKSDFNSLKYLNENVIVLRSVSNTCGYDMLELTYAIGSSKFIEIFEDNNARFNQIPILNQELALAYYKDGNYKETIHKKIKKEREIFYKRLEEADINFFPSETNYILVEPTKTQEQIIKECEDNNIILEHENAFYDSYWSIPLSTKKTNERLLDIITSKF